MGIQIFIQVFNSFRQIPQIRIAVSYGNSLFVMYSSMCFGKCTMSFFYNYSIVQNNFTTLKISCASPSYSSPAGPLTTTDFFY